MINRRTFLQATAASVLAAPALAQDWRAKTMRFIPQANLDEAGIENVTLVLADGLKGHEAGEPYDAIVLTGSVPAVPDVLLHQLALGGRLMAVVGTGPVMEMVRVHCTGPGSYARETLFETWLPPLENAPRAMQRFEF